MPPKSLVELCISGIKSSRYYVDYLFILPKPISSIICDSVILIDNCSTILMCNGNYAKGISCGFDIKQKHFLFGEYGFDISSDAIQQRVWSYSFLASEACPTITKFLKTFSNFKLVSQNERLNEETDRNYCRERCTIERTYLYQQVARWICKYNHYLGLDLSGELLNFASCETISLPLKVR